MSLIGKDWIGDHMKDMRGRARDVADRLRRIVEALDDITDDARSRVSQDALDDQSFDLADVAHDLGRITGYGFRLHDARPAADNL